MTKKIQSRAEILANDKADMLGLFDEKYGFSKEDFEDLYERDEIYYEAALRRLMAEWNSDLNSVEIEALLQESLSKSFIRFCDGYYISKHASILLKMRKNKK